MAFNIQFKMSKWEIKLNYNEFQLYKKYNHQIKTRNIQMNIVRILPHKGKILRIFIGNNWKHASIEESNANIC